MKFYKKGNKDMEKTITIKKGDILDAFMEVSKKDESTSELFKKMSLLMLPIMIVFKKVEDYLFEKTNNEDATEEEREEF